MTQSKLSADGPNAGQIEYWNDEAGPRWVQAEAFLDAQIGEIIDFHALDRRDQWLLSAFLDERAQGADVLTA